MKTLLAIILLMVAGVADAQVTEEWVAIYDGNKRSDEARDIVTDGRGNVYVTGYGYFQADTLRQGIITAKYSNTGEQLWLRGFISDTNDRESEFGYKVAVDSSGNVFVAGDMYDIDRTTNLMVLIKYDPDGSEMWWRTEPHRSIKDGWKSEVSGLAVDREGNVVITGNGQPNRFHAGLDFDYLIYKYRPNGELAWNKSHNGPASMLDYLEALAIDDTGNVYVTGRVGVGNSFDPLTIKYDTGGNVVWNRQFISPKIELVNSVQVDGAGNVYVSGYTFGIGNDTTTRVFTIKYNPEGDTLWTRRWRGPKDNVGGLSYLNMSYDMKLDRFGNVYVLANQNTVNPTPLSLIKYNTDGEVQWANTYQNTNGNLPIEIAVDNDGNVYVASKANRGSAWLTSKFTAGGDFAWQQPYMPDSYETAAVRCWGVTVDHQNNVYVCGTAAFRGQVDNFVTIKYSQEAASLSQTSSKSRSFSLSQNHPNPFTGATTIDYTISTGGYVRLAVYDLLGREIARPVDGVIEQGAYHVSFDAWELPPGNYIYRLEGDGYSSMKMMSVVE